MKMFLQSLDHGVGQWVHRRRPQDFQQMLMTMLLGDVHRTLAVVGS